MPASVSLALLAAVSAACLLWVYRKASNQAEIRAVKKKILAHLMEFRLYGDDPYIIWNTQKALLRENFRYLRLMLRPALVTVLPGLLLLFFVEAWFGRTPLPLGATSVLTIQMRGPFTSGASAPVLLAPPGILVDTAPVRVASLRQVSWRLKALRQTSGMARIVLPHETITRRIAAGDGRVPVEFPLHATAVEWAHISYPAAWIDLFGLEVSCLVYFTGVLFIATLILGFCFRISI